MPKNHKTPLDSNQLAHRTMLIVTGQVLDENKTKLVDATPKTKPKTASPAKKKLSQ